MFGSPVDQAAFDWHGCWTRTLSSSVRKLPLLLTQYSTRSQKNVSGSALEEAAGTSKFVLVYSALSELLRSVS
jgi:hypothetical protein